MEKWWVIKPIPKFLSSFTACLKGPVPEPVLTVNLGCSGNISTYVYGWYTSSSTQVSWRKLMSLKELNLRTRSSWGFGMFLLELPKASGTVGCLCTDLNHWQESPGRSHSSLEGEERLSWLRRVSGTARGKKICLFHMCLHKPWYLFSELNFQRLFWKSLLWTLLK